MKTPDNFNTSILKDCRKQMIRIINKTDQRDTLLTKLGARAIRYSAERIQASPTDKYSEIMANVADLDAEIDQMRAELRRMRINALDEIDRLKNAGIRYVLMLYYTEFYTGRNGRLFVWNAEKIAQYTGYSHGWIYKILRFDLTGH